jgi:hypothetical protein
MPEVIPLTIDAKPARIWLLAAFILQLDPENEYLAVGKSGLSL